MTSSSSVQDPFFDIIIVGSGLAGLTATVKAIKNPNQYRVLLIEKEPNLGGNSAKATSGINLVNSELQKKLGIVDSNKLFLKDTQRSSRGQAQNPGLQNQLAKYNKDVQDFFKEMGIKWLDVIKCGGHSVPRTHRASFGDKEPKKVRNTGFELVSSLTSYLEPKSLKDSRFKILKNTKVIELLPNKSHGVSGVAVQEKENDIQHYYAAKRIILCTGGFSANKELVESYLKSPYPTTNGLFAQGDGLKLAEKHGAKLVDMEYIQLHPTGFIEPSDPEKQHKFLAPEALRGLGGLLIHPKTGKRFIQELETRDHVTGAMLNMPNKTALMIINQEIVEKFGEHLIGFYRFKGLIKDAENVEELAKVLGVNVFALTESLAPLLEKSDYKTKLYYMHITPVVHYTMGGLAINSKGQVLDGNYLPIPGLYGAGESIGGLHGKNRLAGNSLLDCVVFGQICTKEL